MPWLARKATNVATNALQDIEIVVRFDPATGQWQWSVRVGDAEKAKGWARTRRMALIRVMVWLVGTGYDPR
jgi:hypothetical protein